MACLSQDASVVAGLHKEIEAFELLLKEQENLATRSWNTWVATLACKEQECLAKRVDAGGI